MWASFSLGENQRVLLIRNTKPLAHYRALGFFQPPAAAWVWLVTMFLDKWSVWAARLYFLCPKTWMVKMLGHQQWLWLVSSWTHPVPEINLYSAQGAVCSSTQHHWKLNVRNDWRVNEANQALTRKQSTELNCPRTLNKWGPESHLGNSIFSFR